MNEQRDPWSLTEGTPEEHDARHREIHEAAFRRIDEAFERDRRRYAAAARRQRGGLFAWLFPPRR